MPLNVSHLEKGYTLTDQERKFLAKKVGRLSRYCARLQDESSEIRVETVSRDTKKKGDSVKVMITVILPKKVLRAESRKATALEAVDRCCEKLESQIEKYKATHGSREKTVRRVMRRR
ncbi:MAG TPA: HPF/RaiA family ribosome-associated protein [Candidatus Peribacterales bacterium]|nr:HPF/RaiA family ribosome-associated protein [Candidatus Peribacterales bacterium]